MAKKTRVKLSKHRKAGPSDYLVFENPDKRDAGDVTASELSWVWRHCISGPPGSGKRVLLLNQILRMKERPARTVVIHLDKTTREYDKIADEISIPWMMGSISRPLAMATSARFSSWTSSRGPT
jgi:hypothetical protein